MLAIGVLMRLAARGVAVPERAQRGRVRQRLRLRLLRPAADHAGERTEEAGAYAISGLGQQAVSGARDTPARVLPTQLVVRQSSGPAPDRS